MIHIVVYTTCIHGETILENKEERKVDMATGGCYFYGHYENTGF